MCCTCATTRPPTTPHYTTGLAREHSHPAPLPTTRAEWIALEQTAEQRLLSQLRPTVRYDVPGKWEGDPKYDPTPHTAGLHAGEGVHGPVKALLVTATLGEPCKTYAGNWVNVISLKNKRDFAQTHQYGFYWTTEHLDEELHGMWLWVKEWLYHRKQLRVISFLLSYISIHLYTCLCTPPYISLYTSVHISIHLHTGLYTQRSLEVVSHSTTHIPIPHRSHE